MPSVLSETKLNFYIDNCMKNDQKLSELASKLSIENDESIENIDQTVGVSIPNDGKPNIGNVVVQHSSHTMFGNKTIYNAPVTVNQFVDEKGFLSRCDLRSKFCNRKAIGFGVIIILLCSALTITLLILQNSNENDDSEPENTDLRFIPRDEWKARKPVKIVPLEMPSNRVIIAHTVTPRCIEKSDCASQMRSIQNYYMDVLDTDDIGFNFLIGGDGAVYVGRGWETRGEHTYGYNAQTIGISFIGTFTVDPPSNQQLKAAQQLIAEGVRLKKLEADYRLYGQRQLTATESPGEALYKIILKWKNWTEEIL